MANRVLASLQNPYGDYCVDVFSRADGTFGFEEYRSDPENGGDWHSLHRYSGQVFKSEEDALAQAKAYVAWLKTDGISALKAGVNESVLHAINVSDGGVPKLPRAVCVVRPSGLEGDRQRDLENHGGPERAVSLYSLELIQALQSEGHPIAAGTIGENLTLAGVRWAEMKPGARVEVGEVTLQLTRHAAPCQNIAGSFRDGRVVRVSEKVHPGWSRFYARVLKEGTVRVGDRVRVARNSG